MNAREDAVIINSLVGQALISAREVMGDNGLNAVLRASGLERFVDNFPPANLEPAIQTSQYARLNRAIEEFYDQADTPICYLYLGSLGEAVKWATGKEHDLVETHCMAKGDPYCRFEIGEARE
jgi:hypothetical protein